MTVILYVYEDEIKQYAIDELNSHLKTEFQAQDIELSLFHDFPSASIEFKNVFIADAYPNIQSEDTLFHASSMFFNFNLKDIYSGNYTVNRISLHNGGLHLKTAENGEVNFDILKANQGEEQENFDFLLELLEVENFDLRYRNLAARQFYDLKIYNGLFQGDFSKDSYSIISKSDMQIHRLKSNSFTLVKNQKANLEMELAVNTLAKSYTFHKGDLQIEKMPFHVLGVIDSTHVDISISGDDIKLDDLANSLVDESLQNMKSYEGKGTVNFVTRIHGPVSPTEMPAVESDFDIAGGSITEPKSNLTLTDISFKGHYANKQDNREEQMRFEQVKMKMLDSYFNGEGTVSNFSQPTLVAKMDGKIDLKKFHQFFAFENVEKLAGNVDFQCSGKMQFFDPEYNAKRFNIIESEGNLILDQVQYKAYQDDVVYSNITGEVVLNDKDAAANDLLVHTGKSDVLINGAMKNLMSYLDGSGSLGLIASIESNHIDLNEFISGNQTTTIQSKEVFTLPDNLNLNVELDVKNLVWKKHSFNNISTKMLMANRNVNMNNIEMDMLEGHVNGNMHFANLLTKGNVIDGKLFFTGVNINKLFEDWDNFDQKSITHKNLSGTAKGDVDLFLSFDQHFALLDDKLFSKCNVKIENGELKEMETMKLITEYMRSNKALKLLLNKHIDHFESKLLHLQFSDLQNEITITDRKIYIPKMLIRTNALDVELFGWHDFDNQVEYHFSFRYRELKQQITENEFGVIEDDGLGLVIYLTMSGDLYDPDFKLDGEERKKQIRENIVEEKDDVKAILKSEFGLFKKDTTVKKIEEKNKDEIEFIIYDEEEEEERKLPQDSIITDAKRNKKQSSKLFQKWKKESDQKRESIVYEEEK